MVGRVILKKEVCVGHAMCVLACPEIFTLDDEDGHAILLQDDVTEDLEYKVRHAIAGCPEGAIAMIPTSE